MTAIRFYLVKNHDGYRDFKYMGRFNDRRSNEEALKGSQILLPLEFRKHPYSRVKVVEVFKIFSETCAVCHFVAPCDEKKEECVIGDDYVLRDQAP